MLEKFSGQLTSGCVTFCWLQQFCVYAEAGTYYHASQYKETVCTSERKKNQSKKKKLK